MAQKPSIPSGTRDFTPVQTAKRNYIFDTLKSVFNKYGFEPIETPAMENLSTLMGKYGEEGDKLLFKILNSGDFMDKIEAEDLLEEDSNKLAAKFCEKGLRYDLTVPFARFVVQHRNEITFPFKRWQIQPVWRADRPQKGRYREFFQCDVDVIGSNSLLNEVELVQIIDEAFTKLNIRTAVKLNNRKILSGIAQLIDASDKIIDITVAIDKLDKIGIDKVIDEMISKGISEEKIGVLRPIIELSGTNDEKLAKLKTILASSEIGLKGIAELELVFETLKNFELKTLLELDLTLARGLNYYTGAIFEVKALDTPMGSICGGGRYDDLTGIFGLKDVSGVGVSFGADRIFDVMETLNLFPPDAASGPKVLFINFGEKEQMHCLQLLAAVRKAGFKAEIYPEAAKTGKQLGYADSRKAEFAALVGENEMKENKITLKNMLSGEQQSVSLEEMIAVFKG